MSTQLTGSLLLVSHPPPPRTTSTSWTPWSELPVCNVKVLSKSEVLCFVNFTKLVLKDFVLLDLSNGARRLRQASEPQ